jgi:GAF domain-containing protein
MTFRQRYNATFTQFLSNPGERSLSSAYELGRDSVAAGISVLDLVATHHDALATAVANESEIEPAAIVEAAADFLIESLAAFEMIQRGFSEARRAAFVERRNARILRYLSTVLTDESLASGADDALEEVLQLVAENAREITGASVGRVQVVPAAGAAPIEALSEGDGTDSWSEILQPNFVPAAAPQDVSDASLSAPLLSLSGVPVGSIEVASKQNGSFTSDDRAVLAQVAQMTAAAVERALAYH